MQEKKSTLDLLATVTKVEVKPVSTGALPAVYGPDYTIVVYTIPAFAIFHPPRLSDLILTIT
ncbi:hypothetical protein [Rufibacter sp. XAAS-G3-1]|uniref:hypothetical protein n=1 Tax=Rufibacter sp. XAAS-G3-1 TaxID=2729134 RepID=UPI0015E729E5|nr:hypothetical protein [Rufibacter sp. XAAS-G3-1]